MEIWTPVQEEIVLRGDLNIDHPKILLNTWKYLIKNR